MFVALTHVRLYMTYTVASAHTISMLPFVVVVIVAFIIIITIIAVIVIDSY